jgi:hypothetical protein
MAKIHAEKAAVNLTVWHLGILFAPFEKRLGAAMPEHI